jgi:hypothetical protein
MHVYMYVCMCKGGVETSISAESTPATLSILQVSTALLRISTPTRRLMPPSHLPVLQCRAAFVLFIAVSCKVRLSLSSAITVNISAVPLRRHERYHTIQSHMTSFRLRLTSVTCSVANWIAFLTSCSQWWISYRLYLTKICTGRGPSGFCHVSSLFL